MDDYGIMMSEQEEARYFADCEKHGCELPLPVRFRKGPVGEDGLPLYPEREPIAVYPDHTFPLAKPLHNLSEDEQPQAQLRLAS